MADDKISAGDKVKLRFDSLKHIATMSGVGIVIGMTMIEKFDLIEPRLAVVGVIVFAATISVSTWLINSIADDEVDRRRAIFRTGLGVLAGVYFLLCSFGLGAWQEYEYQERLAKYKQAQEQRQKQIDAKQVAPAPPQVPPPPPQRQPNSLRWRLFNRFRN